MENLKIKEAIAYYNDYVRRPIDPKMTQRSLGAFVTPENPDYYISRWCNGFSLGHMKPNHIILLCIATGVDPNFFYGWDEIVENESELNQVLGGETIASESDVVVNIKKQVR